MTRPDAPSIRSAGIGLRAPHYRELCDSIPALGWLEVHSENFFGEGGQPHFFLGKLREHYPLSLHGVGLGLGSVAALDTAHLAKLKTLIARYQPFVVSDHVCWGATPARHLNDLLPLPYTEEALMHFCQRVSETQDALGRQILVENVSSYLRYSHSTIAEWEFVAAIARRTGCGLLLDVNNVYVNAVNHGFDARCYIDAMPRDAVQEIHLAGFDNSGPCLIDTHGTPVCDAVWSLYEYTIQRVGDTPTLIEWDTDIPPLATLLQHAEKANAIMEHTHAQPA
ncbi:MAG: DUF692 domain-containing protein [Betaproteobacteria bacterium]|nr:DUF692 domain-containing protein [Betaproteobacteria bacterium]